MYLGYAFILCMHAIPVATAGAQLTREQLAALIEGLRPDVSDFKFDYEGDIRYLEVREKNLQYPGRFVGVDTVFSGSYAQRSDGASYLEIYPLEKQSGIARKDQIANFAGRTEILTLPSNRSQAQQWIGNQSYTQLPGPTSYGRVLLRDYVIGFARSNLIYRYEGMKRLKEQECVVVRFDHVEVGQPQPATTLSEVFWIDLEHGGHVIHHEQWLKSARILCRTDIVLREFRSPSGKMIWLPVSGRVEGYSAEEVHPNPQLSKMVTTTYPVYAESYAMISNSLRLEQNLPDAYFTTRPKPGDHVTDTIRQARYEFGQYVIRNRADSRKPLSDREISKSLDQMKADADALENELIASSAARSGVSWEFWTLWGIAAICGAGMILILLARMRHR